MRIGGSVPVSKQWTRLSRHQKSILQRSLNVNCYPNTTTIKELASETGLSELKVSSWFDDQRRPTKEGKCRETSLLKITVKPL